MVEAYVNKANEWFDKHREELLKTHKNEWAVIYNDTLIGIYEEFSQAYIEGIRQTESEEIVIKQIQEHDEKLHELSINISLGLTYAEADSSTLP